MIILVEMCKSKAEGHTTKLDSGSLHWQGEPVFLQWCSWKLGI